MSEEMETKLGYVVKKYKDTERERHFFDKDGKEFIKKIKITDNFIVIKDNGDSFVGTRKQLEELGIQIPTIVEKLGEGSTKAGIINDDPDDNLKKGIKNGS